MTRFKKIVVSILLIIAFAAGVITATTRGWGTTAVIVHVINEEKVPVKLFVGNYETCGRKGTIIGRRLEPNKSEYIRFHVCGEGGYDLEVEMEGDRRVGKVGAYVESGYRITVVISENDIKSKQSIIGL